MVSVFIYNDFEYIDYMKHLQLFEGFEDATKSDYDSVFIFGLPDKEDYYKRVDYQYWFKVTRPPVRHQSPLPGYDTPDRFGLPKQVDFDEKKAVILNKITLHDAYQNRWSMTTENGFETTYRKDIYTNPKTGRRYTRSMWLFSLDDEWYVFQDVVQFGGKSVEVEYYLCDQWEGFLELLIDKKVINDKLLEGADEYYRKLDDSDLTEFGRHKKLPKWRFESKDVKELVSYFKDWDFYIKPSTAFTVVNGNAWKQDGMYELFITTKSTTLGWLCWDKKERKKFVKVSNPEDYPLSDILINGQEMKLGYQIHDYEDEYFNCLINDTYGHTEEEWVCDQIEGLIQLLKDKGVIEN